ncbi:uncharacterized protein A4U43_C02F15520 [Asparagus officinalis]|uniref:Uncharacterized protein n=1 Tax=Asparagus officinalis TaxID=4686 RepID=A0A5P1FJD0_ASPOF|nr:uncharacterized protein A4U43_C02F15520 [Asparagus officinalis]
MAVQAQYPSSSSNAFYQDFRTRATQINLLDELQHMNHGVVPFIFTSNDATVFSNPQSELTQEAESETGSPR